MSYSENLIAKFYETLEPNLRKSSSAPGFKPSSIGSKCLRKIYYDYFRVQKDYDVNANIKKMGKLGTGMHEVLSDAYRSQGILIDYKNPDGSVNIAHGAPNLEFPINSPELDIPIGYIDALVILDGKLWLGEYKTCTTKSFQSLKKPKPDHLMQASLYLIIFNKMLKEGAFKHIPELDAFEKAEGIRFVYVDRDRAVEFFMHEFIINSETASVAFREAVQKIMQVKQYSENKQLPPMTNDWCQSCAYRDKCSKNYNI